MGYLGFGLDREDKPGPIEDLLREAGILESRDAQLLMREAYEQAYGLFDHEHYSVKRPLSIVGMHPKENTSAYSLLYRTFYKYRQLDIAKDWGLSIDEFLALPREYVHLIFKITEERIQEEAPKIQAALAEMKKNAKPEG